jgi:hypothetical protein
MAAYDFRITNRNLLDSYKTTARSRESLTRFIFDNYPHLLNALKWLGTILRPLKEKQVKKGYELVGSFQPENEIQKKLFKDLGFKCDGQEMTKIIEKSEWRYLIGGWLEERIFLALLRTLPPGTDIQLGAECQDPSGNKNEFDVAFTYQNILYLVECKSLDAPEGNDVKMGGTINDFLYKLGALRQNFGLTPKAYLAITSSDILDARNEVKPHLAERGKQFGTRIVPLLQIRDPETYFENEILDKQA